MDLMYIILGIIILISVLVSPIVLLFLLGVNPKWQDKISEFINHYRHMCKLSNVYKTKRLEISFNEKNEIIQNLFLDCAGFLQKSPMLNNFDYAIYTAELALHIFSLWYANKKRELSCDNLSNDEYIYKTIGLNSYIISIKYYLNLLLKDGLNQKEVDIDTITKLIEARVNLIFEENDFENRNLNFNNLCSFAIKYKIFIMDDLSKSKLLPVNPLYLMILPQAYDSGLVDKYLKLL